MIFSSKLPPVRLEAPIGPGVLGHLRIGQSVFISGPLVAARDQAHKRLLDLSLDSKPWPFDPRGQIIYYVGPSPAPPGRVIGAAGPTTSGRMDPMTGTFLEKGVKALLGKGRRSPQVLEGLKNHGAVYLAAVGGAGAFYGSLVQEASLLAWPELGPEALAILTVKDFPAMVVYDLEGSDLYETGPRAWGRP
ncbi:MAG: FumA C-terminus/TtdB family hydratase beta subunit [Deltaproteobacteria bacterium]|nr:FumA C-terminus/TtdB family hydratase beta subunit [Deltaproteobacteria bacterium]